jgi:glycosyltransferase involved in cell wall biosynthesis
MGETVEFVGEKYGKDLDQEYDNCQCLVLPSFTENFGGVIIDAMAHGKPCIASTYTPWKELRDRECGWWVSNEPEALAAAICEMITLDKTRRCEMGERGRRLVEEKYTWDVVVKAMVKGYKMITKEH